MCVILLYRGRWLSNGTQPNMCNKPEQTKQAGIQMRKIKTLSDLVTILNEIEMQAHMAAGRAMDETPTKYPGELDQCECIEDYGDSCTVDCVDCDEDDYGEVVMTKNEAIVQ